MTNEYLQAFVIGSSLAVFASFFIGAGTIQNKNYSYPIYTLIAPLYLGLANMVGLYLATRFGWNDTQRFVTIGLISGIMVAIFATLVGAYPFTRREWLRYYVVLISQHLITFAVIVRMLTLLD